MIRRATGGRVARRPSTDALASTSGAPEAREIPSATETPAEPRPAGWTRFLPFTLPAALLVLLGLHEVGNYDIWWHLKTGELICQRTRVPRVDPFTYTLQHKRWINHEWLTQIGLHLTYRCLGMPGLCVLPLLCLIGCFAIVTAAGRGLRWPWLSSLLLGLAAVVMSERFLVRPHLTTFLFLPATVGLLERHRRTPDRWIFVVPLLQLVWANCHGGSIFGLVVLVLYTVGETLSRWLARGEGRDGLRRLVLATLLSVLASFANPNTYRGALAPLVQAKDSPVFSRSIAEYVPTFSYPHGPIVTASYVALALLSALALLVGGRRRSLSHLLTWSAFLYLSIQGRRHLAPFALVTVPWMIGYFGRWWEERRWAGRWHASAALYALGGLILVGLSVRLTFQRDLYASPTAWRRFGIGVADRMFPVEMADFLRDRLRSERIFNDYSIGGYLAWRLYPHTKIFIYGMVIDVKLFQDYYRAMDRPDEWEGLYAAHRWDTVALCHLWPRSHRLIRFLAARRSWQLVYSDHFGVIFRRSAGGYARGSSRGPARARLEARDAAAGAEAAPLPATVSSEALKSLAVLDRARVALGHASLANLLGYPNLECQYLEQAISFCPQEGRLRYNLADLYYRRSRSRHSERWRTAAAEHLRVALKRRPAFAPAHCLMGEICEERGAPAEAEEHYREALRHDRHLDRARLRLEKLTSPQARP